MLLLPSLCNVTTVSRGCGRSWDPDTCRRLHAVKLPGIAPRAALPMDQHSVVQDEMRRRLGPASIRYSWAPVQPLAPGQTFLTQTRDACPLVSSAFAKQMESCARGSPPHPMWEDSCQEAGELGDAASCGRGRGAPTEGAMILTGAGSAAPRQPRKKASPGSPGGRQSHGNLGPNFLCAQHLQG